VRNPFSNVVVDAGHGAVEGMPRFCSATCTPWVACLWAYHEGFQQKDSPEGVASFSHALCAYTPSVFKEPLSAFLSPSMREALHESNFVKALDAVGVGAP
jgi:hypothetical protein